MFKILSRARAIPLREIPAASFPGTVNFDPLEVPVFKLTITNGLQFGLCILRINNRNASFILNHQSVTIYFQECASYDQRTNSFPIGTIIGVSSTATKETGGVYMTAYTYYWEV